ncbi:hypothetical protein FRC12_005694, partial [Ceratobasidium sp. 428]
MADEKKRNLKHDLGRVPKRFKLFSRSSGDPGPSTQSAQNTNTPPMPETGSIKQSTKQELWSELKALNNILSRGYSSFGPLKQAVEGIVASVEIFENRAEYENLRSDLNALFHDLAEFFDASTPPVMAPSIINFARGIERELEMVRLKLSETGIGAHLVAPDDTLGHYRRIQTLLQRLTTNMRMETLRIADEQATETRLKSLPHSSAAKYSSAESSDLRGPCVQNTCVDFLEGLFEWACNEDSQKIYWLNGVAGAGKTTIAYSFCEWLDRSGRLAASFFCSRTLPTCRDVNRIVPTISYQLSRFSRPFRSIISRVLEEDPDAHNQVILGQFKTLILQPLAQVKVCIPADLVIVIDALDECDNNDGVDRLLNVLFSCARELPIKFFVASRPDAKILDRMRNQPEENLLTELRLPQLDRPIIRDDINTPKTSVLAEVSAHRNVTTISSTMPASTIITILTSKRRCRDITEQLNMGSFDSTPISGGGFGDVFRGSLLQGRLVAVKAARLYLQQDDKDGRKVLKNAARELYTWSQLEHKNIVQLLGLVEFRGQVAMVSPWMDNGTLLDYIKRNPTADRYHLCLSISEGVTYLHQNDVIHGDIKSANVLISSEGVAKLTDFGCTELKASTLCFTTTTSALGLSTRWAAPEILSGNHERCSRSKEADVYACGM